MVIRSNVSLPERGYERREEVRKALEDLFFAFQGEKETWEPIVQGGTSAGAGTYTEQYGYYFRQGAMVDLYFSVAWSAHTGTGDLEIVTPFISQRFFENTWIGSVEATGSYTWPTSTTHLVTRMEQDTRNLQLVGSGSGVASAVVQLAGTGSFKGSCRFPIQLDGTRG